MPYSATITSYAQSIHLAIKNRYLDDIEDADGQLFIDQVVDWTNQFLDELENLTDASGMPVHWNFLRTYDYALGTAVADVKMVTLSPLVANLIATPERPVQLIDSDGNMVSTWEVVQPDQMTKSLYGPNQVTKIGTTLLFSRVFTDHEAGASIVGDIIGSVPRLTASVESCLTLVKPKQLLILGVAKNASLPDIVQGGLSPSFVQKYNDLLQQAIRLNNATSASDVSQKNDNSSIGGIY